MLALLLAPYNMALLLTTQTYYTSLIDCTINGDGKTLDTSVTTGPQIPRCFFNLPVVYGEWQNLDGMGNSIEMSNLKDSNQSM